MNTINFKLKGLTCGACVKLATKRLQKVEGVENVKIDLESGDTEITSSSVIKPEQLAQSLKDTHYSIEDLNI